MAVSQLRRTRAAAFAFIAALALVQFAWASDAKPDVTNLSLEELDAQLQVLPPSPPPNNPTLKLTFLSHS